MRETKGKSERGDAGIREKRGRHKDEGKNQRREEKKRKRKKVKKERKKEKKEGRKEKRWKKRKEGKGGLVGWTSPAAAGVGRSWVAKAPKEWLLMVQV